MLEQGRAAGAAWERLATHVIVSVFLLVMKVKVKLEAINIIGNTVFSTEELLNLFQSETSNWLSWATSNDKYAREKMEGDLERLRSYYMDRGYLRLK